MPPQLWRYVLPSEKGEGWAVFVLGSDGYFSAVSDYGNYAFYWRAHGCDDFRQFLLRAGSSWDYFVGKLSNGEVYDGDASRAAIKEAIAELPKGSRARVEKALFDDHEDDLETEYGFMRWAEKSKLEAGSLFCRQHPGDVVAFVQKAMVRLVPLLQADLQNETTASPA
jgi:hypothetical protein